MIKDVKGYESYLRISDDGKVWRKANNKEVKAYDNGYGYLIVSINYKGKHKNLKIHRMVAETFIPKHYSEEKLEVNHIDHDKYNNHVENLEWVTRKENMRKKVEFHGEGKGRYTICPLCNKNKMIRGRKVSRCKECYNKERRSELLDRLNQKGINKDSLYKLLLNNSFLEVGKMFNVSDNAVRKWCVLFDIPKKSSYYKNENK